MSEFEEFIDLLLTDEEAARKQKSDELTDRTSRRDNAVKTCREALVESFDNVRFGHYFKIHDPPPSETQEDDFEFSMAGKDVVLYFTGKVFEADHSPNGYAAMVNMKAARRHSSTITGSEYDVHCVFKEDGECVPEDVFETVTAAVRELIEPPSQIP